MSSRVGEPIEFCMDCRILEIHAARFPPTKMAALQLGLLECHSNEVADPI